MFVRKLVSCFGVRLPFSEQAKDSFVKSIPIPILRNDWTDYKKIDVGGVMLPYDDAEHQTIGWSVNNSGTLSDYYGKKVKIETAITVFNTNLSEINEAISNGQNSLMTAFAQMGTSSIPVAWYVDEGVVRNKSWTAWAKFRPFDCGRDYIVDSKDKLIDTMLAVKIYNPYHYVMKEYYPKEILLLYQELLGKTHFFRAASKYRINLW
jgi:hypothetical protein